MRRPGGDNFPQKMTLFFAIVVAALSLVIAFKLAWRYL
jgi:hypothetical protein